MQALAAIKPRVWQALPGLQSASMCRGGQHLGGGCPRAWRITNLSPLPRATPMRSGTRRLIPRWLLQEYPPPPTQRRWRRARALSTDDGIARRPAATPSFSWILCSTVACTFQLATHRVYSCVLWNVDTSLMTNPLFHWISSLSQIQAHFVLGQEKIVLTIHSEKTYYWRRYSYKL